MAVGLGRLYPRGVYVCKFPFNIIFILLNVFLLGIFFLVLVLSFTLKNEQDKNQHHPSPGHGPSTC